VVYEYDKRFPAVAFPIDLRASRLRHREPWTSTKRQTPSSFEQSILDLVTFLISSTFPPPSYSTLSQHLPSTTRSLSPSVLLLPIQSKSSFFDRGHARSTLTFIRQRSTFPRSFVCVFYTSIRRIVLVHPTLFPSPIYTPARQLPMPPVRTIPPAKALKTERTHEENQERYAPSSCPTVRASLMAI